MIRLFAIVALMSLAMPISQAVAQTTSDSALPNDSVDFERHVAPLLSKFGCNAGSCHGAAEGKRGFKLSLFGSDMDSDYAAIVNEEAGRVDMDAPDESLLLEKPTTQVAHEGGQRFEADSLAWHTIREWIHCGADRRRGNGLLKQLTCEPSELHLRDSQTSRPVKVIATFEDGSQEDVTAYCELRIQDETVAALDQHTVCRVGGGDTHLIADYRGYPACLPIFAPHHALFDGQPESSASGNRIDQLIHAKLTMLGLRPSPIADDAEFLRRVTLTTIGQIPTSDDVRSFLADTSADKRERLIDRLLAHPLHASLWATRMCEITGSNDLGSARAGQSDHERERKWHAWFKQRFEKNVPYDELVQDIFAGTTRDGRSFEELVDEVSQAASIQDNPQALADRYAQRTTFDLFWQRPKFNEQIDLEELAERVSASFLGVRIECARCHKHPFDRWTQDDYRAFANLFTQVRVGLSPDSRGKMADLLEQRRANKRNGIETKPVPTISEVFLTSNPYDLTASTSDRKLLPRPLGSVELPVGGDRRVTFAQWLTSPENPMFARNFVNRVWQNHFGRGLVEPVDSFSTANPASHPRLLDYLAKDFIESGFDVRRLERQILASETWQRTSIPDPSNAADQRNFARFYVRPLRAEALIDAIRVAGGTSFLADSAKDPQLPAATLPLARMGDPQLDNWFHVFQRPERKLTCDCEQRFEPTLRQAMLLLSDQDLRDQIRNGELVELLAKYPSDSHLVEELFLRTLSRFPDDVESAAARAVFDSNSDRGNAAEVILWSLINTREFVTYH